MSRRVWEVVETKAGKVRIIEAKERRGWREGRKEMREKDKKTKKEAEERKNNRCKKFGKIL